MNKAGWWLSISWFTFLLFLFPFFALADATFEMPYTLDGDARVHCEWDLNSYNGSNNFYSYGIEKDGALISSGRTSGKTLCQDAFIASTASGGDLFFQAGVGEYKLTLYAESGLRDPYGYMVFDCPADGICTVKKLTSVKTWHSDLTEDTTWEAGESPYLVDQLTVDSGVSLRIESGALVLFRNKSSFLYVAEGGTLDMRGTSEAPITLSTINDDGDVYLPTRGDWDNVINYGTLTATHVHLSYATHGFINHSPGMLTLEQSSVREVRNYAVLQQSGTTSITNSTIENSGSGVGQVAGEMYIFNSTLSGIDVLAAYNKQGEYTAVNNYWGHASGPHALYSNEPSGTGEDIGERVLYMPWLSSAPTEPRYMGCVIDCFSNVLFLPGFEGTRLYEKSGTGNTDCGIGNLSGEDCFYDDELWVSRDDDKHAHLSLDGNGQSLYDVYTQNDTHKLSTEEDETGIVDNAYILDVYDTFLEQLHEWKSTGLFHDYAFIPYDWRLSLEDIVTNGRITTEPNGRLSYTKSQSFDQSYILHQLERLQASSNTGKVILIGHSNGGLVAKALVQKLKDTNHPLYSKIEQVILVTSPQAGTPEAAMLLTHGIDLFHGLLMTNQRSRQIGENMPGAYNLLPSSAYFDLVNTELDPIVAFENHFLLEKQRNIYGEGIETFSEMKSFLLGGDGRMKPEYSDTKNASIGNSILYERSEQTHNSIDNWQPHPNTKVVEIAGWGEETISGFDYVVRKKFLSSEKVTYKPRTVIDGDGTVVVPSAFATKNTDNTEEWYVDLNKYNSIKDRLITIDHKNILGIKNLINLINYKIQNKIFSDEDGIILNNNLSLNLNAPRLHFTLHSPLALGIKDSEGHYTGLDPITGDILYEIPGVNYEQIGEVQFLSVPTGVEYTLLLNGLDQGSFALDIDAQSGNIITDSTIFEGIPASKDTRVTLEIGTEFNIKEAVLKIDTENDGVVDIILQANETGRTLYEEPKVETPQVVPPVAPSVVPVWILDQAKSVIENIVEVVLPLEPEPVTSAESEVLTIETNTEILNIHEDAREIVENILPDTTPIPEMEPETSDMFEAVPLEASVVKVSNANEMLLLVFVFLSIVFIGIRFIKR